MLRYYVESLLQRELMLLFFLENMPFPIHFNNNYIGKNVGMRMKQKQ